MILFIELVFLTACDMAAFDPPQIRLYAKQTDTGAAVFVDCPAVGIRERFVGAFIYQPGKTYSLTHKTNAPKLFTVLQYLANTITEDIEIDLVLRSFNPYTQEPRPVSRMRFPQCLNETLSPDRWQVEVVQTPSSAKRLNDEIVLLPIHTASVKQEVKTAPLEVSKQPQVSTTSRRSASDQLLQKSVPVRSPASRKGQEVVELRKRSDSLPKKEVEPSDAPDLSRKAMSGTSDRQFEFIASDKDRVREILKRWVQLSESIANPWSITYKKDDQGFTIRDQSNRVIFDYQVGENNVLSTTQSGLVLQEMLTQVALTATTRLSPHDDSKLLAYANEVLDRLQLAPTETAAGFMRSLFQLTPARKTKRGS